MKKIVIMSDNHGDQSMIDYVKEQEQGLIISFTVAIVRHMISESLRVLFVLKEIMTGL